MASPGAIRAGQAYVQFGADTAPLLKAMGSIGSTLKGFGLTAKVAVGTAIGNVLGGAAQKIAGTFSGIFGQAAQVESLAKKFGMTTQEVSGLAYAFERQGVDFESFKGILEGLSTSLSSAADDANNSFKRIGLNARGLINLPLPDALDLIVDGLGKITLQSDRIKYANEFGLGALLPVLDKGSAGLKELRAEAERVGAALGPEEAGRVRQVMQEYTRTWQQVKAAVMEAGLSLLPSREQIKEIGAVAAVLVQKLRQLASEIGRWAKEVYDSLTGASGAFREVRAAAEETVGGIVAAVTKGDLVAAFKVLTTGVKALWFEMLGAMGDAFKDWVKDHQNQLIALGSLMGGVKGGKLGARFGPWGAVIGGGLGAGAGAGAGYGLSEFLQGLGDNPTIKEKARAAREELAKLAKEAMAPGVGSGWTDAERRRFEEEGKKRHGMPDLNTVLGAVKGGFALPAARQQFGYGDNVQRNILGGIKRIADKEMPEVIDAARDIGQAVGDLAGQLTFK